MNNKLKIKNENVKHDINDSRRNLTKASATLPFLMSFSRPLWAADECQPSDLQSGNMSVRPGDKDCFGMGMSATFFQESNEYWVNASPDTLFNAVFEGLPIKIKIKNGPDNKNPTFQQVLDAKHKKIRAITDPDDYPKIGKEAQASVAYYLNCGLSPNYTKKDPVDTALTIDDVLAAFYSQTAVQTFSKFEL